MVKKTGLGKGLDALFSMPIAEEEKQKEGEVLKNLKIIEVEPNRNQPRRNFDQESLQELAESIKMYGIIQPIVVTDNNGYYSIIAGERRWRAAKLAGLTEIPAIIREDDAKKNKEISLIENIQREDLNPIEKAEGIRALMDEYSLTQEEVSKILGKSRSGIANTVRILNLSPNVLELVRKGKLTEGHCRSLLAVTDPEEQYKAAIHMIESGQSVRQIEKRAQREKNRKSFDPRYEAVYRNIENKFQGFFGTKVKVDAGARSGKIIISYSTNGDLERILGLINGQEE